ncbi:hypothetical protein CR513_23888, partial [Mucuna pruriens]
MATLWCGGTSSTEKFEREREDIREMRSRFEPGSYAQDLYNKFQRMYQGSKIMEEYHKDTEVALLRANVLESNEATMA